jgi:hypothetical protein
MVQNLSCGVLVPDVLDGVQIKSARKTAILANVSLSLFVRRLKLQAMVARSD